MDSLTCGVDLRELSLRKVSTTSLTSNEITFGVKVGNGNFRCGKATYFRTHPSVYRYQFPRDDPEYCFVVKTYIVKERSFENEQRACEKLCLPHTIVECRDSAGQETFNGIAFPEIKGRTLAQILEGDRSTQSDPIKEIAWEELQVGLAAWLAFLSARDLCHFDFQPENCMITNDGLVRVIDFGTSKAPRLLESDLKRGLSTTGQKAWELNGKDFLKMLTRCCDGYRRDYEDVKHQVLKDFDWFFEATEKRDEKARAAEEYVARSLEGTPSWIWDV